MGMTWWLRTRRGDSIECDQSDHTLLNRLAEDLDRIASRLGVRPLSEFVDYVDIGRDFDDLGEEIDEDEREARPEPAPCDYAWFDPREGLASVAAILEHVRGDPSLFRFEGDSTRGHWRGMLIEDLEDCRAKLERASEEGLPFHLTLVQ
jgi:hypothetical protein